MPKKNRLIGHLEKGEVSAMPNSPSGEAERPNPTSADAVFPVAEETWLELALLGWKRPLQPEEPQTGAGLRILQVEAPLAQEEPHK